MDMFASHTTLAKLTNLGDPTFLICMAFGAFFYLWVSQQRRLAEYFAVTVGACMVLIVCAKFVLVALDSGRGSRLRSPSGHVAVATTVYGCCVMILTQAASRLVRYAAVLGVVLFLLLLAGTRLALQLHSFAEVVVGFAIGAACLLVFSTRCLGVARTSVDVGRFAALLLLLGVTRFASVDAEEMIGYGARLSMPHSATNGP